MTWSALFLLLVRYFVIWQKARQRFTRSYSENVFFFYRRESRLVLFGALTAFRVVITWGKAANSVLLR